MIKRKVKVTLVSILTCCCLLASFAICGLSFKEKENLANTQLVANKETSNQVNLLNQSYAPQIDGAQPVNTYVTHPDASKEAGVKISNAKGVARIDYTQSLDLSNADGNIPLLEFVVAPTESKKNDINAMEITLTDNKTNESIFIKLENSNGNYINIFSSAPGQGLVNYDSWSENKLTSIRKDSGYSGTAVNVGFNGTSVSKPAPIRLAYDNTEKALYLYGARYRGDYNTKSLLRDYDGVNAEMDVSKDINAKDNPFNGFSDSVSLKIVTRAAEGRASQYIIQKVNGKSLNEDYHKHLLEYFDYNTRHVFLKSFSSNPKFIPAKFIAKENQKDIGFIKAPIKLEDQNFDGWYQQGKLVSTEPTLYRELNTRSRSFEARYSKEVEYKVNLDYDNSLGNITYKVVDDTTMPLGKKITLTATANEGNSFVGFYINNKLVSTETTYSFPMMNVKSYDVKGVFKQNAKYIIRFVRNDNIEVAQQVYTEGDTIVAPSDVYRKGYNFVGWSGFNQGDTATKDMTYLAKFTKIENAIDVTVTDGELITKQPTAFNNVTVKANAPKNGEKFGYWTILDKIVSYDSEYTFVSDGNVAIKATFVSERAYIDKTPSVVISNNLQFKDDTKNYSLTPFMYLNIDFVNIEILERGFIGSYYQKGHEIYDRTEDNFTLNSNRIAKINDISDLKTNYLVGTINGIEKGHSYCVRGYITYKQGDKSYTVYSNIIIVNEK